MRKNIDGTVETEETKEEEITFSQWKCFIQLLLEL